MVATLDISNRVQSHAGVVRALLNARYYDGSRGQFLSQDPVFRSTKQNLAHPQSLNSYSYANDNPINRSDPSGLLTFIIPGTWYNSKDWSSSGSEQNFISAVGKTFNETPVVINNKNMWSGADTSAARSWAAQVISGAISQYKFAPGEQLNIVGLSHGGNVGIEVSQLTSHKIDNLVTIGTPVRSDYQPNSEMIANHINAYSNSDPVQTMGGGQTSVSQIVGYGLFGIPGGILGGYLDWDEFGPAGRQYSDATNIDETKNASNNPYAAHGSLWSTPQVWADINGAIDNH